MAIILVTDAELLNSRGSAPNQYKGRLELTWTNKHLRLLSHEDGSYQWVPPPDYRVAEVRLLHDVDSVGAVGPESARAKDNLLIRGDALNALTSLVELPEFAREYVGKVKLAYLDPPFNTQQAFEHYDDALEHSVWLTMMRDRLLTIRTLLSPDGSVWVHCDDSEQAYLKVLMDEVFGREAFIGTVVWQKSYTRRNDAKVISVAHDYLLAYAARPGSVKLNQLPATDDMRSRYRNPDNDPRGNWKAIPLHAPNIRPNLTYAVIAPDGKEHWPPPGNCWRRTKEEFAELIRDNRIYFGANGKGLPNIKKFWAESQGTLVPWTWWPSEEVGNNGEAKNEIKALFSGTVPFDTPKPERLLHRITQLATSPGDIVLDCFLGSGTTVVVAHKMGRRWVGVEWSASTLDNFTIPRLTKVVEGKDTGGITKTMEWKGGGGFRILEVAPSMFTDAGGQVFLSDWATDQQLAEATAAQLHFEYRSEPPFCGRKGRSRLAVVDGLVNEGVVRLLVGALSDGEGIVICGTAVDPKAEEALRTLRPGSTVRKIPQSLLRQYRQRRRWLNQVTATPGVEATV